MLYFYKYNDFIIDTALYVMTICKKILSIYLNFGNKHKLFNISLLIIK